MLYRTVVIMNPAAGGGRAAVLERTRAVFARAQARIEVTTAPQDEERLAREAAQGGAETIVAVGGDGTWGNVAHGIYTSGAAPRLALLAAGTGNDFVKSVATAATDPAATQRMIEAGAEQRVDLGLAGERVFLNCCGFGFDVAVLQRLPRVRVLRGSARYVAAALAELFRYDGAPMRIEPWPRGHREATLLAVIANGRWYGGAFRIAPDASADDGMLDVIRIRDVRGWRRLALLRAAMQGRHVRSEAVETGRGDHFRFTFDAPPIINVDGEIHATSSTELEIRVLPGALRLVAMPRRA